jgi:hypothetical protein
MMRRSNAVVSWSIATAMTSLLTVAPLRAGRSPADPPLVSEQYFKNIQVLKGMPVDTFFDAMGMFAASIDHGERSGGQRAGRRVAVRQAARVPRRQPLKGFR